MKNYSYVPGKARFALSRAPGRLISAKDAREVAMNLRGLTAKRAEEVLNGVIGMTKPIKFARYNTEVGHKPGIGPGRFPVNAAKEFLLILKNAIANARQKGLDEKKLIVARALANRSVYKRPGGARVFSKGPSHRSRRASIEIVLEERK